MTSRSRFFFLLALVMFNTMQIVCGTFQLQYSFYVQSNGASMQGQSIALSQDGSTVLVGGPGNNNSLGAAWMIKRTNSLLSIKRKFVPLNEPDRAIQFGISTAMDSSTSVAVVGGYNGVTKNGAAWVMVLTSSNAWSQQKLVGSGDMDAMQGRSISIASDATLIFSGAPNDDGGRGAVYVFLRQSSETWTELAKLISSDMNTKTFGSSLKLSADSSTLVIGAPQDNNGYGSAFMFTKNPMSNNFTQQQVVNATLFGEEGFGEFGFSVDLSSDGGTVVVGAPNDGDTGSVFGAAFVFKRNNSNPNQWIFLNKLVGIPTSSTDGQGFAVAINSNAQLIAVGSPWGNSEYGALYVYILDSSSGLYVQYQKITAFFSVSLGYSIAFSGSGETLMAGSPGSSFGIGSVYTYSDASFTNSPSTTPTTMPTSLTIFPSTTPTTIPTSSTIVYQQVGKYVPIDVPNSLVGKSSAISADGNWFAIGAAGVQGGLGGVFVYALVNGQWQKHGNMLLGSGYSVGGVKQQGYACALSGNGETLAMSSPSDEGFVGSVWIFFRNATGQYNQQGNKLTANSSDATAFSFQGASLDLGLDGDVLVVGASNNYNGIGCVFLYVRFDKQRWIYQGQLMGSNYTGSDVYQGRSVVITNDASRIVFGGHQNNNGQGALWVFVRKTASTTTATTISSSTTTTTWEYMQEGMLTARGGVGSKPQLGSSVAIDDASRIIVAGMPYDNDTDGALVLFQRYSISNSGDDDGTVYGWIQLGNKITIPHKYDYFGTSVSISNDGNIISCGGSNFSQAIWVFKYDGRTNRYQQWGAAVVLGNSTNPSKFGLSMSVDSVGNKIVVGGSTDHSTGAAWLFQATQLTYAPSLSPTTPTPTTAPSVGNESTKDSNVLIIVVAVVAAIVLLLIICAVNFAWNRYQSWKNNNGSSELKKWIEQDLGGEVILIPPPNSMAAPGTKITSSEHLTTPPSTTTMEQPPSTTTTNPDATSPKRNSLARTVQMIVEMITPAHTLPTSTSTSAESLQQQQQQNDGSIKFSDNPLTTSRRLKALSVEGGQQ